MRDQIASAPDRWLWISPIVIAVAIPMWLTLFTHGWLEMLGGSGALLFWPLVLIWLALVTMAIRRHRWWWLLVTTPFVLYPVVMLVILLGACASGNCL